jgi:hypothetical protein
MGLCPAGQSTTIEWQYPEEIKNRIIGADDYSIIPVYSQQSRYRCEFEVSRAIASYSGRNITVASQACNSIPGIHRDCLSLPRISSASGFGSTPITVVVYAPVYQYRVIDFKQSDYRCGPWSEYPCTFPAGFRVVQVLCHGAAVYSATPVWVRVLDGKLYTSGNGAMLQSTAGGDFSLSYDSVLDQYKFSPGQQPDWSFFRFVPYDNRKPVSHLFKIFKEGIVVYQKQKPTPPVVTYFCGEKCPPGTCECTCGNKVCCHDPVTGVVVKSFIK